MSDRAPVRICIVTQQLGKVESGPGIYSQNLINRLYNSNFDVTVITPQGQIPEGNINGNIFSVRNAKIIKNQARWFIYSFLFSDKISELERSGNFDLIHFTDFRDAFFCKSSSMVVGNINDTYCAESQSIRYYRQNYHDWLVRWIYYSLCRFLENKFVNKIDLLIANSNYTKSIIIQTYPHISSKVMRIYKSVNINHFQPVRTSRDQIRQSYPHNVILVGSNLQRKGIYTLITSAEMVLQKIPDMKFLIAGNDPSIPHLERICNKLGINDSFIFLGNLSREKLLDLYSNAGVMVLPAITEALGVVLLEAMVSGIPVIASNVGGIPEIIRDQENGILIPPGNPGLLSEAILRIFDDQELRKLLISRGFEMVRSFSLENMIKDTFNAYDQLLGVRNAL